MFYRNPGTVIRSVAFFKVVLFLLLCAAIGQIQLHAAPFKIQPLGIVGGRIIGGGDYTPAQYFYNDINVGATHPGMSMNNLGQVVEDIGFTGQSLIWLPAPAYGLSAGYHYLPTGFRAQRIGPAGHVVGVMVNDMTGAIWYSGGFTNLGKNGLDGIVSLDVNFRGAVFGTAYHTDFSGPQRYVGTAVYAPPGSNQLQTLYGLGGGTTWALRCNNNADIVGYDTFNGAPFITKNGNGLTPGSIQYVTGLSYIFGTCINNFSDIGGIQTTPAIAKIFSYAPSGQTDLPGPATLLVDSNAPTADVLAINGRGQLLCVLNYNSYLYQHGSFTALTNLIPNNSGWSNLVGADLNDNGYILGEGTLSNQTDQAFLMIPAGLDAKLSASPDPAPLGGNVTITLTLSNSSAGTGIPVTFTNVGPNGPPTFDGTGAVQYLSGPSPGSVASLAPGATASFAYFFRPTAVGDVRLFGIGHGFSGTFFPSDYASTNLNIKQFVAAGHVFCACNSNAVPNATVQVGTNIVIANSLGYYACSNVVPGPYTVIANAADFYPNTNQIVVLSSPPIQTNDIYLTNATFLIDPIIDSSIVNTTGGDKFSNTIVSATHVYSQYIADPVCAKIRFYNMITGLGQSYTFFAKVPYSQYYADLHAVTNLSSLDTTALQTLHAPPDTGVFGNSSVLLTAATLDALGEHALADTTRAANAGFDSQIGLNLSIMNASRPGADTNNYDASSTVQHEVDEGLGIGGGGSIMSLSVPYNGQTPPTNGIRDLDLYRYSSAGVRSFTLNSNVASYFSIDGGTNVLVHFNQYGDDSDFGDWGNGHIPAQGSGNTPSQVQDAFAAPGAAPDLGGNELIALDVIGYTLRPISALGAATLTNGHFNVALSVVPGQKYQLQATDSLNPPAWQDVGAPFVASGMTASAQDPTAAGPRKFYRVISAPASGGLAAPARIVRSLSGFTPQFQLFTNVYLPQR